MLGSTLGLARLLLPLPRDSFTPCHLQPAVGWDDAFSSAILGRFSASWRSLGTQGAFQIPLHGHDVFIARFVRHGETGQWGSAGCNFICYVGVTWSKIIPAPLWMGWVFFFPPIVFTLIWTAWRRDQKLHSKSQANHRALFRKRTSFSKTGIKPHCEQAGSGEPEGALPPPSGNVWRATAVLPNPMGHPPTGCRWPSQPWATVEHCGTLNLLQASPLGVTAAPARTILASRFVFRCWTGSDSSFLEDTDLFHIQHWAGTFCSRAGTSTSCVWL